MVGDIQAAAGGNTERHYVRCHDCLSIVVIDRHPSKLQVWDLNGYTSISPVCSICGGRIDYMGRVSVPRPDRLVTDDSRCVCNELCVSARGPKCSCACGGKNHGVGLFGGYVTVQTDRGPVPTVSMPESDKAIAIAEEWRARLDEVVTRWRGLHERRKREYLGSDLFRAMLTLDRATIKARGMSSQSGRLRVLQAAMEAADKAEGRTPAEPVAVAV